MSAAAKLNGTHKINAFLTNFVLISLGVVFFVLSHPNIFFKNGVSFLAWIMYVPVFLVIYRSKIHHCIFWGALFGYFALTLFSYWVGSYHFFAGVVVGLIYLTYFAILFPFLKLAIILFPRFGYLAQLPLWVGFEYLRTLGFVGYAYGITGYTQWQHPVLIQIASIFGVWGVSALVIFPSILLANFLWIRFWEGGKAPYAAKAASQRFSATPAPAAIVWLCLLIAAIIYGNLSQLDYEEMPKARIALVQNNADPWKDEKADYRNNFLTLKRLSEEVLAQSPAPELVVWSETAFVPMIYWNIHYRTDAEYYAQVKELIDFLKTKEMPFLIGNDDGRRVMNEFGYNQRIDYNAAILLNKGEITDIYRKIHLVPFAEYFPYKKQLPLIYNILEKTDTHFWEPGKTYTVFDNGSFKFSTPICFEDTFGYLSREFVKNGAEIIVNISNDSWSASLTAQMQHLSMAVFRSVENRRSMARSTASGQTCGIDPNGKIVAELAPFTAAALTVELPVVKETTTFYTKHGDFLPVFSTAAAVLILLCGAIWHIIKYYAKSKKNSNSR
ncbi:apolipoprotein N-acyltransferase 1 [Spirochaetia bacterium]|nr:apolipoprotein N-acyltransferase 1 [Spirochaetia bacterium]